MNKEIGKKNSSFRHSNFNIIRLGVLVYFDLRVANNSPKHSQSRQRLHHNRYFFKF